MITSIISNAEKDSVKINGLTNVGLLLYNTITKTMNPFCKSLRSDHIVAAKFVYAYHMSKAFRDEDLEAKIRKEYGMVKGIKVSFTLESFSGRDGKAQFFKLLRRFPIFKEFDGIFDLAVLLNNGDYIIVDAPYICTQCPSLHEASLKVCHPVTNFNVGCLCDETPIGTIGDYDDLK